MRIVNKQSLGEGGFARRGQGGIIFYQIAGERSVELSYGGVCASTNEETTDAEFRELRRAVWELW
jgi:hypothetical protein